MLLCPRQLHAAVTEMEQDKFKLQTKHTENIQELLEDTNLRLAQMEAEYIARSRVAVSTVGRGSVHSSQFSV